MITHEEFITLVENNPNDAQLGAKIRELYHYDSENPYRNEDSLPDWPGHNYRIKYPAQPNITEGTSVTSHDFPEIQLELNINRPEKEDDLDLNLAYTSARKTPFF